MALPEPFSTVTPQLINYDFTDVAEGTGSVNFFLALTRETSNEVPILTSNSTLLSYEIESTDTGTHQQTTYEKVVDDDYDLSAFNTPRILRGTSVINMCLGLRSTLNGQAVNAYIKVRLRKWNADTTTETEVASVQSQTLTNTTDVAAVDLFLMEMTVPKTNYAARENIRITIEVWAKTANNPSTAAEVTIGHDPKNRDGAIITPSTDNEEITKSIISIPFDIEQ